MKTNASQSVELATVSGTRPADFPIGSPHSRAAARKLAEERDISAMQDWTKVTMEDPKRARAFARKLRSSDPAIPLKVRLIVRTHSDRRKAEAARNRVQPGRDRVSLSCDDEKQALRLVPLLAERHGGVLIYVDVVLDKAGRK
jgi:hypothetical protein